MKNEKLKSVLNIKILICILSLFSLTSFKNFNKEVSKSEKNKIEQNINIANRYVGAWKLVGMIPAIPKNDRTMDGIICKLEKYENTNETFVFHLFGGRDLILSVVNNNKLKGENANMIVVYKAKESRLHLSIPGGSTWIFKKLK